MAAQKSEKQIVEEYLKNFALEECLDEIINDVIERRPDNPYMAIARSMESKTLPEIIEVYIYSTVVANGCGGIEAKIVTNLDQFIGTAGIPYNQPLATDILQDYSAMQTHARDALKSLDPRNLDGVDVALETLLNDGGLNRTACLAISIACCRAGARHKGMPLYLYLADSMGGNKGTISLPMPVMSVLSRAAPGPGDTIYTQELTAIPTTCTSLENAMEAGLHICDFIKKKLDSSKVPMATADCGCPRLSMGSIEEAVRFVAEAIGEAMIDGELKTGVDMRSMALASMDEESNRLLGYQFEGPTGPMLQGSELADSIVQLWRECEIVSIEDPLERTDVDSFQALREKMDSTVAEVEQEMSDSLSYHLKGVGGDAQCRLQVVCDAACISAADVAMLDADKFYNAVKVNLGKIGTVSKAMAVCKAASDCGWTVVVGTDESAPETLDTFLTDFAVAVGAGQLSAGGVNAGENLCKYNRLLEIFRGDDSLFFAGKKFRK